jgi:hypothetical protein
VGVPPQFLKRGAAPEYDCKFATFSYTLSALINSKSTIIGAMNDAAVSYLVQRNIAET